jgi:biotin-dependent carboxylase-like uncharacterized protein
MSIKILEPGFNVTVQDYGRPKFQHLGVPVSGAISPILLRLGNSLVSNSEYEGGLEMRLMGPTFEVLCDSARIALVGTSNPIEIIDGDVIVRPANQSITVKKGQIVRIGNISDAGTAYLAIEGGFNLPKVYDSLSTYVRAGIGGYEGRALLAGDVLSLNISSVSVRRELKLNDTWFMEEKGPIRIILGPQDDYFSSSSIETFLNAKYTVTTETDRMGIRLDGPKLEHSRGYNIVSDGIVTGAIQVPGTGQPILLLADHQTTGGYPKLGTVISGDISRLGLLCPGEEITFLQITVGEAEQILAEQELKIKTAIENFKPADPWLDYQALYNENLISGFM